MMNLIVCIDDYMGMMFNNRRQSKDLKVIEKIQELTRNSVLYVAEYSKSLFPEAYVFDDFAKDGYYFIENPDLIEFLDYDSIIIFKWNRHYPSDKKFDFNLQCYNIDYIEEFEGSSHEKITMEVYSRKESVSC